MAEVVGAPRQDLAETTGDLPVPAVLPGPRSAGPAEPAGPADAALARNENPWVRRMFAAAVAVGVLLAGGLAGTLVERDRARRAEAASATGPPRPDTPAPSGAADAEPMLSSEASSGAAVSTPEPEPEHPLAVFAASLDPGACVDFASDGTPTWQPVLPAVVDCESPRALQRVLGRADSPTARASCMDVDGRGAWLVPGGGTVCLERLFHVGECVPAQVRDGRYWAYLFDKVGCAPAAPDAETQRLRIVAVLDGPKVDAPACFQQGAVHYPLPSRDGGLCAAPVRR
jgi:hypothetical protein